ncbi:MAG: TerC family protein [Pseudomonadota bacterium]|nr:TerC family protein [Pseudomonadota bacterium]
MESLNTLMSEHAVLSNTWLWISFAVIITVLLFLDLCVFHRHAEEPKIGETFRMSAYYIIIALIFGLFIIYERGSSAGILYYTGYLVEKSLSMDNIFVISLVFTSLKIPGKYQHRVLFWGILGAIAMRAIMIFIGAELVAKFHWILYIFSLFLIYTGIKIFLPEKEETPILERPLFKFIRRRFHVTHEIIGEHFFVRKGKLLMMTPLFFALIIIEIMDVIFAIDSIPAIFLITQDTYIVYTSNIFAILGLRALYFLLAAAVNRFAYLKQALAFILVFIGSKIFLPYAGIEVTPVYSLIITFSILFIGIAASLYKTRKPA